MWMWFFVLVLSCRSPEIGAHEGHRAPDFEAVGLDAQTFRLDDALDGPVVLSFWASWCAPCRAEAPHLSALEQAYAGRVRLVSVNAGEAASTVAAVTPSIGVAGTVLLDPQGTVQAAYEVSTIPMLLVLDEDGVIRYRGHGLPQDIHRLLDGLLG